MYKEWKLFCENEKKREKKSGGEGGCVQRMKVIVGVRVDVNGEVKLLYFFFYIFFFLGGGGGGGRVGGGCGLRSEDFVKIQKEKKNLGGGGWVGLGVWVRVDVN